MNTERHLEGETISVSHPRVTQAAAARLVLTSLLARITSVFAKMGVGRTRALRLCESLSLGDKRVIAIVECDHQRFLLGSTPHSISLLQTLGPARSEETQVR